LLAALVISSNNKDKQWVGYLLRPFNVFTIFNHDDSFLQTKFTTLFSLLHADIVQSAHQPGSIEDGHNVTSNVEGVAGVGLKEAANGVDDGTQLHIQLQPLRLDR